MIICIYLVSRIRPAKTKIPQVGPAAVFGDWKLRQQAPVRRVGKIIPTGKVAGKLLAARAHSFQDSIKRSPVKEPYEPTNALIFKNIYHLSGRQMRGSLLQSMRASSETGGSSVDQMVPSSLRSFPASEADIAADYFSLRKTFTGSKWAFSEVGDGGPGVRKQATLGERQSGFQTVVAVPSGHCRAR
jgi:hypothetical protein